MFQKIPAAGWHLLRIQGGPCPAVSRQGCPPSSTRPCRLLPPPTALCHSPAWAPIPLILGHPLTQRICLPILVWDRTRPRPHGPPSSGGSILPGQTGSARSPRSSWQQVSGKDLGTEEGHGVREGSLALGSWPGSESEQLHGPCLPGPSGHLWGCLGGRPLQGHCHSEGSTVGF